LHVKKSFNPWRAVCGFYPPDVVACRLDLTDGQKRLYERLVRWAGQQGTCWYGLESMAEALGKSRRQVIRDAQSIERYGLIRRVRRGGRLSNVYEFLWHPMFDAAKGEVAAVSHHSYESEVTRTSPHAESEVTPTSPHPADEVTSTVGMK
jgi:predicted transcriptional regulator